MSFCYVTYKTLQAVGKRPFGHSSLSVYIDGSLRTQSSLKYPSFVDPISYCQFGCELSRANLPVVVTSPSGSNSFKENIKVEVFLPFTFLVTFFRLRT